MRILIVEDDETLGSGLVSILAQSGYQPDWVSDGLTADAALSQDIHDLAVLDLGLPGIDGFEVLRRARGRERHVPILLLTARDSIEDRVRGLDLGADDYLVKPFAMEELEARIRALCRRAHQSGDTVIRVGRLTLDLAARRARVDDLAVRLTGREWSVLQYLALRAGRIVRKDQIAAALDMSDAEVSPNAIEVHISRLRAKLANANLKIHSIRSFGYYIEKVEEDAV